MNQSEIMAILVRTGALTTGSHIVYTSERHGKDYVDKDAVYTDPEATDRLCFELAQHFQNMEIDVVAAPAIGGVNLSQGVARHLSYLRQKKVLSVFAEPA